MHAVWWDVVVAGASRKAQVANVGSENLHLSPHLVVSCSERSRSLVGTRYVREFGEKDPDDRRVRQFLPIFGFGVYGSRPTSSTRGKRRSSCDSESQATQDSRWSNIFQTVFVTSSLIATAGMNLTFYVDPDLNNGREP